MTSTTQDVGARDAVMPLGMRIYLGSVIAAGAVALAAFAPRATTPPMLALTFLAAMLLVSLFKLRIPLGRGESTLSMAYMIDFTVLVAAGADLAVAVAALGVLVQCTVKVRRRQPWYRTAFSMAAVVLGVAAAGWAVDAFGSSSGATVTPMVLLVAALIYFAVNSGLVATAVALSTQQSPLRCWLHGFLRTAPSCLAAAGIVGFISFLITTNAYVLLASTAVPLVVCHLAYAVWFRRIATRAVPVG